MRIIFQDIDGPLIPHRMYYGPIFDKERSCFIYDAVAVGMVNELAKRFDAKIVFNTAHNTNSAEIMKHQAICNSLGPMHDDIKTLYATKIDNRYAAIQEWLSRHPEVTEWIVIDDWDVYVDRQIKVDYNIGLTLSNFIRACELFGEKISPLLFIGSQ